MSLFVQRKADEQGLTLVELLVVMIIVGLIAAIAVPIFLNQQKKAKDTALTSDIRNAATAIADAKVTRTWAEIRVDAAVPANTLYVDNDSGQTTPANSPYWNTGDILPEIAVTPGTFLEIVHVPGKTGSWSEGHTEDEYCITATNLKSNYNYVRGSGVAANYKNMLFYDTNIGGVVTMDKLVQAEKSGGKPSCYAYARQYIAATGL